MGGTGPPNEQNDKMPQTPSIKPSGRSHHNPSETTISWPPDPSKNHNRLSEKVNNHYNAAGLQHLSSALKGTCNCLNCERFYSDDMCYY